MLAWLRRSDGRDSGWTITELTIGGRCQLVLEAEGGSFRDYLCHTLIHRQDKQDVLLGSGLDSALWKYCIDQDLCMIGWFSERIRGDLQAKIQMGDAHA